MQILRSALAVSKLELGLFSHFPKLRVWVLGIILIPALYAFIYLNSVWDPTTHTSNLPAAIVNLDQGTQVGETPEVNWCRLARVASDRGASIDGQGAHWHNLPMHLSEGIGMPTRNVVLTNYQASFVERLVSTGRYQNASEVLREGLRMVEQREAEDASRLEALRSAVNVGVADFEQGRYATFESGAELRGHLASVASKAIAGA